MRMLPDVRLTRVGYEKFKKEKEGLLLKRKEALVRLQRAREMGDLSENGAYKAARAEVSDIDRRLRYLELLFRFGKIVDSPTNGIISIGSRVKVKNEGNIFKYEIVGGYESNPLLGRLSEVSPIGKALLGRKVGDKVIIEVPAGKVTYTIVEVEASS